MGHSIAQDFYLSLMAGLEAQWGGKETPSQFASLGEWAAGTPISLDGRPFSFQRHEYLRTPYEDMHPHQVELKATQLGLTTKAMLKAFWGAHQGRYKGVLYLFPSKSDVLDFSKGRISPLIEENPETIGTWLQDTDTAGIKRIGGCTLYLRGMVSRVGLKSVPADIVIFDELDEAPQKRVDMAMERMGHSEVRETLKLSNPTLPDYGIDLAYQATDQRHWLLKCPGCGHYNDLIDIFMEAVPPALPRCFQYRGEELVRACERCGQELDLDLGEWVAKKPQVTDQRGYHYSQLLSHYVTPAELVKQFQTTNNLQDFYNLKIGVAWIEAHYRLDMEEILGLCGQDGIASSDPGPCFMGVDQGSDLHVVIGRRHWERAGDLVHLEIYKNWEDLDRLMEQFHVARCVVDGLPETRNARAFAKRWPGRVYLNYYQEKRKGSYAWNDAEMIVACNRTESMDASHQEIVNKQLCLPKRCGMTEVFAKHLNNVAKKLEEDEDTGSKRYVYVKLGPDHFRHAFNYEAMARQYGGESIFGKRDMS